MTSDFQLNQSDAPNLADVNALRPYIDENGEPSKPFPEWFKSVCSQLESQNAAEWAELHLVWEMINHFKIGRAHV